MSRSHAPQKISMYRRNFRPSQIDPALEDMSVSCSGAGQAGDILRRHHVPRAWGDPVDAVGFFDDTALRGLAGEYANGRLAVLSWSGGTWTLDLEYVS